MRWACAPVDSRASATRAQAASRGSCRRAAMVVLVAGVGVAPRGVLRRGWGWGRAGAWVRDGGAGGSWSGPTAVHAHGCTFSFRDVEDEGGYGGFCEGGTVGLQVAGGRALHSTCCLQSRAGGRDVPSRSTQRMRFKSARANMPCILLSPWVLPLKTHSKTEAACFWHGCQRQGCEHSIQECQEGLGRECCGTAMGSAGIRVRRPALLHSSRRP